MEPAFGLSYSPPKKDIHCGHDEQRTRARAPVHITVETRRSFSPTSTSTSSSTLLCDGEVGPPPCQSFDLCSRVLSVSSSLIDQLVVDDCLLEIFLFATSGWDSDTLFSISQVSKHWRYITLANSSLWTGISVDESSIDYSEEARLRTAPHISAPYRIFPRVGMMLERSVNSPISVKIDISITRSGQSVFHPLAVYLANLLSPHRGRIIFFQTKSASWTHHTTLAKVFTGDSFPVLRSLLIECPYKSRQEFQSLFPQTVRSDKLALTPLMDAEDSVTPTFPNLRELSFFGTVCDWFKYPGRNLSTIVLAKIPCNARPSIAQLCSILAMSKDTLTVLQIHGSLPYSDRENGVVDVELPHLETLSLAYTMPCELVIFLDHVRVPALKTLAIENLHTTQPIGAGAEMEYEDTLAAFEIMTRRFPLEQIEDLRLAGLMFGPPPELPEVVQSIDLLPTPFQFMQRLPKARVVQFDNAERYLLRAACYPVVGGPAPQRLIVLPELQRVVLTARNHLLGRELRAFLEARLYRWDHRFKVQQWEEMEVSVPQSVKDEFCVHHQMIRAVSRWSRVEFKHATDPEKDDIVEFGAKEMDFDTFCLLTNM